MNDLEQIKEHIAKHDEWVREQLVSMDRKYRSVIGVLAEEVMAMSEAVSVRLNAVLEVAKASTREEKLEAVVKAEKMVLGYENRRRESRDQVSDLLDGQPVIKEGNNQ